MVAVPRTSDGRPDLQGVLSFATITPIERPKELAGKEFLTDADVAGVGRVRVVVPSAGGHLRVLAALVRRLQDDGKRVVRTGTVERPSVELVADFAAGTFTPNFPNGTPVSVMDPESFVARAGDLVWRGGRAVREPLDAPQGLPR